MAVSMMRPVRHLLFKEVAAVSIIPSRHHSELPPVKTQNINGTLQLRTVESTDDKERPLAVLFGWMLAKKRHLNKYGNLYLSKGFDVLTIQLPPTQVLWPLNAQKRISSLLSTLQDSSLASRPLLIHGFSVGGYLYGEMLVKLGTDPKYKTICDRMVGQVFDSPVDYEGVARGFANVLVKNTAMKSLLRNCIDLYLKGMHGSVTKHYIEASAAFHSNVLRLPSLFLYSRADPIGVADVIEGVMTKWQTQGISVSHRRWDHSPHVSHFHHHPDEYVDSVLTFLETVGFTVTERQDGEGGEKDLVDSAYQQAAQGQKIGVPSGK